jgi:hypothetical protein
MPQDARSTEAEVLDRVGKVYDLLLAGASRREILQFVAKMDPPWGVETRQIDNYIAQAKEWIKESAAVHRDEELGKARTRLEALYKQAFSIGAYKVTLAILRELNALSGLYPVAEQKHSGEIKVRVVYDDADNLPPAPASGSTDS